MNYMVRHTHLREDPSTLMPNARTILCVALPYKPAKSIPTNEPQIAMYAYGEDYHRVIRRKLKQLLRHIKTLIPTAEGRICVDSAPIFEKYYAEQAGIGFIGRNTQLIVPHYGSMVLLGELLLNIELPTGKPLNANCGKCRRCIDACPTQAIVLSTRRTGSFHPDGSCPCGEHYSSLDCHKCLSYQTIEHNGELPQFIKEQMANHIYGCDTCIKICPHNANIPATQVSEFIPSPLISMNKEAWQALTPIDFDRLFHRSAIKRIGYTRLMRNIAASLSNIADTLDASNNT